MVTGVNLYFGVPVSSSSSAVRDYFIERMKNKVDKLLVESRTEYIRQETLEPFKRAGMMSP